MSDSAAERISSTERDGAVRALTVHREAGRLDSAQFESRQVAANAAQTWGELVPLFADLPEPRPAKVSALVAYAPPGTVLNPSAPAPPPRATGSGLALTERAREKIMALTPFAAVILSFTTHTWLWFLAIPVMGILLYGPEGRHGRRRGRR